MAVFGSEVVGVRLASLCLIGLIIFTIGFELLTAYIDDKIRNSPEVGNVVSKLYKELMILGFISFAIFIVENINSDLNSGSDEYDAPYNATEVAHRYLAGGGGEDDGFHEIFINLEFAHILIFFVAILFIVQAMVSINISQINRTKWDVCEHRSPSDILEEYFLYKKKRETMQEMHTGGFVADRKNNMHLEGLIPEMKFHVLRAYFLKTHIIPHDIDFPMYLSESLSTYIIELVEVDISSWMCLVFLLSAMAIIWPDSSGADAENHELFFNACIALGWFLFFLNVGLYVVAQKAMSKLMALADVTEDDDLAGRLEMVVRETIQVQELQAHVTQSGLKNKKAIESEKMEALKSRVMDLSLGNKMDHSNNQDGFSTHDKKQTFTIQDIISERINLESKSGTRRRSLGAPAQQRRSSAPLIASGEEDVKDEFVSFTDLRKTAQDMSRSRRLSMSPAGEGLRPSGLLAQMVPPATPPHTGVKPRTDSLNVTDTALIADDDYVAHEKSSPFAPLCSQTHPNESPRTIDMPNGQGSMRTGGEEGLETLAPIKGTPTSAGKGVEDIKSEETRNSSPKYDSPHQNQHTILGRFFVLSSSHSPVD